MKILISNDDGIDSPGIQAIAKAAKNLGDIFVVAPNRERSTAGHSLTLHKPVRIQEWGENQFSTSGTPADCIYLGIREVLKGKPDLILSGINNGANLGTDIFYSGTVAAAREGALMNIPSYAFSMVDLRPAGAQPKTREPFRFEMAAEFCADIVRKTLGLKFPNHTLLNVNVPNLDRSEIRGVKVARQGFRYYAHEVTKRTDPRGRDYYWIGGPYVGFEKDDRSDCHVVEERFISVAPLTIDCTADSFMAELSKVNL